MTKREVILLEQYKLFIQGMEKVSDRRLTTNNYFVAINTALISLLTFSSNFNGYNNSCFLNMLGVVGILVSQIWFLIVLSHKQLNSKKFELIHEIEKKLPLNLYEKEWELLGRGRNFKKYIPFSNIEMVIPWIFTILYVFMLFISFNYC